MKTALPRVPRVRTRVWWAAVGRPTALATLFPTKAKAELGRFKTEHVVRVRVEALHPAERALKLPRKARAR